MPHFVLPLLLRLRKEAKSKKFLFCLFSFIFFGVIFPFFTSAANPFTYVGKLIIVSIVAIPVYITGILNLLAATLLRWVIRLTLALKFTQLDAPGNDIVKVAWPIMRDLGNLIIVVSLIAIAVATILRWPPEYDARKLLPRLIMAALLINFSLLICGVVIDAANILIVAFTKSSIDVITKELSAGFSLRVVIHMVKTVNSGTNIPSQIGQALGYVAFNIMGAIIFFLFASLYAFRILAIWVLTPLSALAGASWGHPATKRMVFDKWLNQFLQWNFIGASGSFFIYLGSVSFTALKNLRKPIRLGGAGLDSGPIFIGPSGTPEVRTIVSTGMSFVSNFIPAMFLGLGFIFSLQFSAIGSDFAVSLGKKVGFGAAKYSGRLIESTYNKAGRLSGVLGEGQTWRGQLTRRGERLGSSRLGRMFGLNRVLPEGTELTQRRQRVAAATQRIAVHSDNPQKLAEIANKKIGRLTTEDEKDEIAAAAQILAQQKKLDLVPKDKQEALAQLAVDRGAKKTAFIDNYPHLLAVTDEEAIASLRAKDEAGRQEKYGIKGAKSVKGAIFSPEMIAEEKERLRTERARQRTLGFLPVTDEEARARALDNRVNEFLDKPTSDDPSVTERQRIEAGIKARMPGLTPEGVRAEMQAQIAQRRQIYAESAPLSTLEIQRARESLVAERGTPEFAAQNPAERERIRAQNPGISEEDITSTIIYEKYGQYRPDFSTFSDDEIAKIANKNQRSARGARAIETLLQRRREDLLVTSADGETDEKKKEAGRKKYIGELLEDNQRKYGSNAVQEAQKFKSEYAYHDVFARKRLAQRLGVSEDEAGKELVRRAQPRLDTSHLPKNVNEQIEKVLDDFEKRYDETTKTIDDNIGSDIAELLDQIADKGVMYKVIKGMKNRGMKKLELLGNQLRVATGKFGNTALQGTQKANPLFREYDEAAVKEKRNEILIKDHGLTTKEVKNAEITHKAAFDAATDKAKIDVVESGFKNANIANLSNDALASSKFILNAKIDQLTNFILRGNIKFEQINALKRAVAVGTPEGDEVHKEIIKLKGGSTEEKKRGKELDDIVTLIMAK